MARPRAVSGGGGWGEPRRPEDKPWESQGVGWWGGGPCRGARVCRALAGRYVGGSWGAGGCLSPGTGTRTQALLPRGQPASHVRDWARPWVPVEAPGTAARVCLLLGAHGLGLLGTCPCPGHSRRLALPSSWAPGPQAWPGLPRSRDCISPPSGNVAAVPAPAGGPAGPLVREPEPGLLQLSGPEQPEPATEDPWVGRPSWPWGPSRLFPGGCGETPPQTPAPSSPGARDPGLSGVLRCWGRVSPGGRGLDCLNPRAPRLQVGALWALGGAAQPALVATDVGDASGVSGSGGPSPRASSFLPTGLQHPNPPAALRACLLFQAGSGRGPAAPSLWRQSLPRAGCGSRAGGALLPGLQH